MCCVTTVSVAPPQELLKKDGDQKCSIRKYFRTWPLDSSRSRREETALTRLTNAIISDRGSVHEKVGVVGVASGFA